MMKKRPRKAVKTMHINAPIRYTCYVCRGLGYLLAVGLSPRLCPHCAGVGFQKEAA